MARKVTNKSNNNFYKIFSYILLILTVFTISTVIYFDVLPIKYLIPICLLISLLILFLMYKLNHKTKLIAKIICILISIIIIFIESIGNIYAFGTIEFFNNIFDTGYRIQSYGVYVLKESNYKKLKDLNKESIAFYYPEDDKNFETAQKKLERKISFENKNFKSIKDAVKSLNDKEISAIFVNESLMNIYLEDESDDIKLLSTIEITIKDESEFKNVNVTKDPFVLYISGVDSTGSVRKSSRSDVNILLFVNPKEGKALLLNTPRDYYVTLPSKNAKDKLTHAGIYGIEESASSLEKLYDIEVNYYIRVNFTSFIKIIDSLGGITVDVQKPDYRYNHKHDCGIGYVCEQDSNRSWDSNIKFKTGRNLLNGEEALAYARNRHQYANGDNARGAHQEQIIKAIFEKMENPSILTKYNTILKSLSSGIITNVEQKTITKFVNYQLDKNIKWEVESFNVKGNNSFEETYSLGKLKASVLIPKEDSINEAKMKVQNIMNK